MNSKTPASKIKVIKHDDSNRKTYRNKDQYKSNDKFEDNNNININDDPEDSNSKDNNSSSLLPFIEKIIATPLHFMKFNSNNSKNTDDSTDQYIIIGDKGSSLPKKNVSDKQNISNQAQKVDETPAYRPKSLAESLLNYITPSKKRKIEQESESSGTIPAKKQKVEFDEKKEDLVDEKTPVNSDIGEDIVDEDLGEDLDDEDLGEDIPDEDLGEDIHDEDLGENIVDSEVEQNKKVIELKKEEIKPNNKKKEPIKQEVKEEVKQKPVLMNDTPQPKPTKKQLYKQKIKTPKDINKVSQLTINLKEDHGSRYEPKILTKNWILGDRKIEDSFYPRGLVNHGVTCYINSAIQSMLHIPALQNYLIDLYFNREKYPEISTNSVTWQLAETSKKMWQWTSNSVINKKKNDDTDDDYVGNLRMNYRLDPKKLISRLEDINCMMSEWEQEDSHEYFMSLMSRLQEDSVPKGKPLNESIIHQIFGGKFNQRIRCGECGEISITQQQFYDLSLVLAAADNAKVSNNNYEATSSDDEAEKVIELEECIKQFFKDEVISDGYNCEKCGKSNKKSVKTTKIQEEPEYLCVHLKKYEFDGSESKKMKQKVEFNKYLDMNQYKLKDKNSKTPSIYQLISVTSHTGRSLSSGHYTTKALQPDGSWARYDDDLIESITEKDVLERTSEAYYLVYARLTPLQDTKNDLLTFDIGSAGKTNIKTNASSKSQTNKKDDFNKKYHSSHSQKRDNNGKFTSKKKHGDDEHKKVLNNRLKKYNNKNKKRKEGKSRSRH